MDTAETQSPVTLNLTKEEFTRTAHERPKPLIVPLYAEISLPGPEPVEIYAGLRGRNGFILESVEGTEKSAQFSFICTEPRLIVTIDDTVRMSGDEVYVSIAGTPGGNNPVEQLQSVIRNFPVETIKEPRFFGGMAGFFAYDMVYSLCDKVERHQHPGKTTPLAQFMLAQDCIVCDHPAEKLYVFKSPLLTEESDPGDQYDHSLSVIIGIMQRLEELRHPPKTLSVPDSRPDLPVPECRPNVSKDAFKESVARAKEYIAAGDILQAVLSQKTECPFDADPFSAYLALREINPGPYLYFLDFGERQVIGSSPEMLVRVENRQVTTVPIAGTRPRGRDEEEDRLFAKDLLADEKERAEHTMLVDLARNDVGRVSEYGTVMVENFMDVEKFSHVQHIVSTVTGELREDLDAFDALKSCFPAGTVSGAPKIRAMQIIEELEPGPRGIYAGAAGYIGFNGNMDFAIAIRTIVIENGIASIQAGAGIVADSVPENEFQETLFKAKAMQTALMKAGAVR